MFHWRHSSISLQIFFSYVVNNCTQKCQTWIGHFIILFHWSLWALAYQPSEQVFSWLLPFHKDHSWSSLNIDCRRFFRFLYTSLNTTSWVSSLFADFPLRVAKLWFYVCQILCSLAFWMEWCDWKLVLYKLASFQWINLTQHVYVMLKHVWCNIFHSIDFDMK